MNHEEMLEVMPHRGANVLIDSYEDTGPTSGRGTLTIGEADPVGRDLFLVLEGGRLRYSAFFLVEHVALNSVLILREDMGGGRLACGGTHRSLRDRPARVRGDAAVPGPTGGNCYGSQHPG